MQCELCGGTGLLPFSKDGRLIPNAWQYCECHKDEGYSPEATPDDADFPCSDSFRAYFQREPMVHIPELSIEPSLPIVESPEWTQHQWDSVQQLKGMVLHLQSKVAESHKKRQRGKY